MLERRSVRAAPSRGEMRSTKVLRARGVCARHHVADWTVVAATVGDHADVGGHPIEVLGDVAARREL
jgi:hypothetical protein